MLNHQTIRDLVTQQLLDILMESSQEQIIQADEQLRDLGINSLQLARLIVQLNCELDVDPFAQGATITDMRTISDIVTTYEKALQIKTPSAS